MHDDSGAASPALPTDAPRGRGDRGAALVEFALVAPMLILLILGGLSFGVVLARRHALDEAVGEAARAAAVAWDDPATAADERSATALTSRRSSGTVGDGCSPGKALSCTVSIGTCTGDAALSCLTVTVVHDRNIDPIVGRLPVVDMLLPRYITTRATVVVNGG